MVTVEEATEATRKTVATNYSTRFGDCWPKMEEKLCKHSSSIELKRVQTC